jgi:hypothetical protein
MFVSLNDCLIQTKCGSDAQSTAFLSYTSVRKYIIITVIIRLITIMQDTYNYIPETNYVSRAHSVAAVLYLQFVLRLMLFHPWNIFCYLLLLFL